MEQPRTEIRKRISIRRRFLTTVLIITIVSILAVTITGFFCIRWVRDATQETLVEQLEMNVKQGAQERSASVDAKLEHYEKYVEFIVGTINNLYANEEQALSLGRTFDPPVDTHEYMLTRGFATNDLTAEGLQKELLFFSNLERAWEPIAKGNEGLITTQYLGTKSGLLVSYDPYSYLSCPPPGEELIYDYYGSEWYKMGMSQDGVFHTGVYVDSQGRGLTMTIGSRFKNAQGEDAGVVCIDFDLSELYRELFATGPNDDTLIFAFDQTGTLISPDSDTIDLQKYTGLTRSQLDELKADPNGIMELNDSLYICIPLERTGWTICARAPKDAIREAISATDLRIQGAFLAFLAVVLLIFAAAVIAVNRSVKAVTYPLELLGKDIKRITDGDLDYRASVYRNDEIGDITSGMNAMVDRLNFTLKELMSSQQHADAMSRLATFDSLTKVRNKTAFDAQSSILQKELSEGKTEFGFAMIDLNNLKLINDNFGHEKGDIAIKAVCQRICEVFARSPVFRVGGDEFVVILQNADYQDVESLVRSFKEKTRVAVEDRTVQPWERASAAIGYALYDESEDSGTESVLSRADKEMYACKKRMKSE